jgi:hypothetical protein
MDDLPSKLTEAQESRLWAAFQELNHKLRETKEIGWNECIREAYAVCALELPHESAVALVVRYGRQLKWLAAHRPFTGRSGAFRRAGEAASLPSPGPAPQLITEADWRLVIAGLVADLIRVKAPRAAKQVQFPERAVWLQAQLTRLGWNKHMLARYGGPDHKSTQKVLDGLAVAESVLAKIAEGLSAGGAKVDLLKIPRK